LAIAVVSAARVVARPSLGPAILATLLGIANSAFDLARALGSPTVSQEDEPSLLLWGEQHGRALGINADSWARSSLWVVPASCSRKIPMICSSLNRLPFIVRLLSVTDSTPFGGIFGARVSALVALALKPVI